MGNQRDAQLDKRRQVITRDTVIGARGGLAGEEFVGTASARPGLRSDSGGHLAALCQGRVSGGKPTPGLSAVLLVNLPEPQVPRLLTWGWRTRPAGPGSILQGLSKWSCCWVISRLKWIAYNEVMSIEREVCTGSMGHALLQGLYPRVCARHVLFSLLGCWAGSTHGGTQRLRGTSEPASECPVLAETPPSPAIPQGGPCLLLQCSQPGTLKSKLGLF